MDTALKRCNTHYYLREKYFGIARKTAKQESSQLINTSEFSLYHGLAYILEGQQHIGISELTTLQSDKDVHIAAIIALIYAHKQNNSQNKEILYSLENKLKEERKVANSGSLYYAGLFLSFAGKYEKASEYINKSLKKDPNNLDSIVLKGWNDMFMSTNEMEISILDCLELALNKSDRNVEALLGLAKFKYLARDHEASNLTLDRLIVNNPNHIIPLVEKLKNEFAMKNWEAVYDTIERIFVIDPNNIDALKIKIYLALCKNSDYIEATDQLNRFFTILESEETHNGYIFYNTAQIFSKICARSSTVLSQVYRFVQYASEMYPDNIEYLSEIGYQCILQGKYKDAVNFFKAASKRDSNSITALCGLTLCQMHDNGPTEQIIQQVELLLEMQGNNKWPVLYLISAQLNAKSSSKAVSFLNTAFETVLALANLHPFSLTYIKYLDPDFLLEVYKEYKKQLPKKAYVIISYLMYSDETYSPCVEKCFKLLETVCLACPALIPALFELAKLKFLFGNPNEAQKLAQDIGELDNTHAGSQVLLAQICIQQKEFVKAAQNLEICLSYSFKIRDSAMYHFLNGVILKNSNQLEDALSSYKTSLQIASSKNYLGNKNRSYDSHLSIIDKATLYMQMIELQTALGQHAEAGKTMQEAIQELSYTSEETRLSIARADLALNTGDVDGAIDILNEIKPGQPYYFQAHSKMAHIYLKEKKDRAMFTTCFKEVVNNHPMADAHLMMGDAYMSIHEPIQAAESYEAALKGNPKDIHLIKKFGDALVKMHEYDKAIQHYEDSIKLTNNDEIMFENLDLLVKLKKYDKVDSIILFELNEPRNKEKDITTLKRRVRYLQIQAKSRELKNPTAVNTVLILTEAKELQTAIVKRIEIDSRGNLLEEKQMLTFILCSLAKVKSNKEPAIAAHLYSEALVHTPRDPSTLLSLAKLYAQVLPDNRIWCRRTKGIGEKTWFMWTEAHNEIWFDSVPNPSVHTRVDRLMNNTEKCEQTCAVLLNTDPNNESAAVMMADLAFRKVDLETAQRHLVQLLSVKPTSWEALAQLVEVQWRRGRLSDVEQQLEAAKQALGDKEDPGYWYCSGVHAVYAGRANPALRLLNAARRAAGGGAGAAGGGAARRMALLCMSHRTAPTHSIQDNIPANDDQDTRLLALRTAEKLLSEVDPIDRKPLQALLQLATKQKSAAERVLQELLPLTTDDTYQDDPYLILAIANAYNIIKQPTRAKNILKRTISSIPWTPERADGLERCWLEIADNQVTSGRADAAKELLTKILNHNQSCATAYQYLGFLAEKDQNYKSAAHNYDNAWTHSGRADLAVGYKLAHAHLKLKNYPECIVVCRHILKAYPDYPKIKKDILEKAKNNLRT